MTGLWLWRGPSWSASLRDWQADDEIIADRGQRFQRQVSAALNGPFLGLLHEDCADQTADGGLVGEDADRVPGRSLIASVKPYFCV